MVFQRLLIEMKSSESGLKFNTKSIISLPFLVYIYFVVPAEWVPPQLEILLWFHQQHKVSARMDWVEWGEVYEKGLHQSRTALSFFISPFLVCLFCRDTCTLYLIIGTCNQVFWTSSLCWISALAVVVGAARTHPIILFFVMWTTTRMCCVFDKWLLHKTPNNVTGGVTR